MSVMVSLFLRSCGERTGKRQFRWHKGNKQLQCNMIIRQQVIHTVYSCLQYSVKVYALKVRYRCFQNNPLNISYWSLHTKRSKENKTKPNEYLLWPHLVFKTPPGPTIFQGSLVDPVYLPQISLCVTLHAITDWNQGSLGPYHLLQDWEVLYDFD